MDGFAAEAVLDGVALAVGAPVQVTLPDLVEVVLLDDSTGVDVDSTLETEDTRVTNVEALDPAPGVEYGAAEKNSE